ncbi:MAG: hypothetical protein AB1578_10045 [Thermodesulfobacteriota bacterium]
MNLAQAAGPEQEALGRWLLAWKELYGDTAVLVRELLDVLHRAKPNGTFGAVITRAQWARIPDP